MSESDYSHPVIFRNLPLSTSPTSPTTTSTGLSSITYEMLEKLSSKIKQAKENKSDVDSEGLEIKQKIDDYFQKENKNYMNGDLDAITLQLSDNSFTRKAFEIGNTGFSRHKAIFAFAFFDHRKRITTMSKLVEKNKNKKRVVLSDIFVTEKCRIFKKDDRSGKFRILLCFVKIADNVESLEWYISEQVFDVVDQGVKRSNESDQNDSIAKRTNSTEKVLQEPTITDCESSFLSGIASTPIQLIEPIPFEREIISSETVTQLRQEMETMKQEMESIRKECAEQKRLIQNLISEIKELKEVKNQITTDNYQIIEKPTDQGLTLDFASEISKSMLNELQENQVI